MKKNLFPPVTLAVAIAGAFAANAGEVEEAPPSTPPPSPSLWNWFIGGSGGYLVDAEEAWASGHVGIQTERGDSTHSVYLEVGWTSIDEEASFTGVDIDPDPVIVTLADFDAGIDLDIIPITLNYMYERPLGGKFNWYLGAGAGVAIVDVDIDTAVAGGGDVDALFDADDEAVFFGQVFTGVSVDVSEQFSLYGGARWIFLDEIDVDNDLDLDVATDNEDDVVIEAGGRLKF